MFISTSCPTCGVSGEVPRECIGMTVRCKKCGASFEIVAAQAKTPSVSVTPSAAVTPSVPMNKLAVRRPLVDMAEILMDLPGRDDGSIASR